MVLNVGNAGGDAAGEDAWEHKLSKPSVVDSIRNYIAAYQPDVVLLSEVYRAEQLLAPSTGKKGKPIGGPILPVGYAGRCHASIDRDGMLAAWNAVDASHEHECIGWRTSRFAFVSGSAKQAPGRNDGPDSELLCSFDSTGFALTLRDVTSSEEIRAVTVHPNFLHAYCRVEEIGRYWSQLAADHPKVVLGGDFNTADPAELQVPVAFRKNFSLRNHWGIYLHPGEHTHFSALGPRSLDHAFSNFGRLRTTGLAFGSVVGGHHAHPRADGGTGCDHRQILVDMHRN